MMSTLFVWKEQLQELYAKYSKYIMKAFQFVFGLLVFGVINHNIGYMKNISSFTYTLGLSAICAFLPIGMTLAAATCLILAHIYALSLPLAIVTFIVFLLMYIFYFKFTPETSWLVLLTPVAFVLKIPFVIPVAFGLLGTPVFTVPAVLGTVIYYMLYFIKMSSSVYKGGSARNLAEGIMALMKQIFTNKEMWVMAAAVGVSLLIVYFLRTRPFAHCWKIASLSGTVTAVIIATVGNIKFDIRLSYAPLLLGGVVAVVAGVVLEFLFFAVDYSAMEFLQFEDNEYYYYVKAIPKLGVSAPKRSVKHINERRKQPEKEASPKTEPNYENAGDDKIKSQETTVVNADKIRRATEKNKEDTFRTTDEILLAKSLTEELGISGQQKEPDEKNK